MNFVVYSGGQTGADFAALKTAKAIGIPTGGWMPAKCITKRGMQHSYLKLYNMKEHTGHYKERTWQNVQESDLTIRLATNFSSAGEKCTLNAIRHYNKPVLNVNLNKFIEARDDKVSQHFDVIIQKIVEINPKIINIAGNCDAPLLPSKYGTSIEEVCCSYLNVLFNRLLEI